MGWCRWAGSSSLEDGLEVELRGTVAVQGLACKALHPGHCTVSHNQDSICHWGP